MSKQKTQSSKKQSTLFSKPEKISCAEIMGHLVFAWLFAVMLEVLILPSEMRSLAGLQGLAQMNLGRVVLLTVFVSAVLSVVSRFVNFAFLERCGILFAFTCAASLNHAASPSESFFWILALVFVFLLIYLLKGNKIEKETLVADTKEKFGWIFIVLTAIMTAAFILFVSAWTVGRYLSFSTPTFDFGIFAQMFHNMKETGLPMTTVERDGMLSHFAVHVSPIYYLMLPFYCIFPSPATIQVLQAVVLGSAVIPLWKIGKHYGLSGWVRTILCGLLLLYPALSGGTSYDIHENCFLTPLILWVLYAIDRKNTVMTAIFTVLVLMVKEDAAMYIAIIALWLIVKSLLRLGKVEKSAMSEEKKNLFTGVGMLAVSLIWFLAVTSYLATSGDGVMTYRYSNFMYDGSDSLMTVIKSVILNPFKALYECVDPEKLKYIGLTLLPLLGLPLATRRFDRLILLIPYLLVNLMSDYQYQHDIYFQYSFGSTAFLFYLTAVNVSDWKMKKIKFNLKRAIPLGLAIAYSALIFAYEIYPVGIDYYNRATEKQEYYDSIRNVLDTIPEDASVSATTYYTSYLSEREVLYDIRHSSTEHVLETEYVVMNVGTASYYKKYETDGKTNGFANFKQLLEENGYVPYEKLNGILEIYRKP